MTYEIWSSKLEDALRKARVSAKERARAREYWDEAYEDRCEAGMSPDEAVSDLGSVDEAVAGVIENLPPFQRSFTHLGKNQERSILALILIILGAIVWVPLIAAFGILAAAVYVTLWALIVAAWALVGTGYLIGITSIAVAVVGFNSISWVSGVFYGGFSLQ